jgi:hypothetical protein
MNIKIKYLTILFLLLITSSCCCWKGKTPKGLISPKEADAMEEEFKKTYYPCFEKKVDGTGKPIKRDQGIPKVANKLKNPEWYQDNRQGSLASESDVQKIQKKLAHANPILMQSKQIVVSNTSQTTVNKAVREVWFSLEEIENFIGMIKAQTPLSERPLLGIRIYFGTYVNDGTKKVTLFLVATKYNGLGYDEAKNHENLYHIYPLNYGNTGQEPVEYNPN